MIREDCASAISAEVTRSDTFSDWNLRNNVKPGWINHGLLIRVCSPTSDKLIILYLNATLQLNSLAVYESEVYIMGYNPQEPC